ncbi:MAG: hypothetical protein C7B46_20775 [Sulfobacillus benefaciens]|uniref:Uncharacterized protein n=1 Tax=Sulfobacillus benefaciens TaxID=453960 RepID=A0A2T2WSB2_9FIRM|nr:MAG: hypothetical protein C7B46_20775 [Sulfobacillus benefaciens]
MLSLEPGGRNFNDKMQATFSVEWAILGGVIGSMVMAIWAMMVSLISGKGFWVPVQLIAATWFGPQAMMHMTVRIIVVGLITHMMVGAMFGLVLAGLFVAFRIRSGPSRLLWGIGCAIGIWIVNQYAILPTIDPMMATHMSPWAFALGHRMFGVNTATFFLNPIMSQQTFSSAH